MPHEDTSDAPPGASSNIVSAPASVWAVPGISAGAKLVLLWWWGKATPDEQQDCAACTVSAPVAFLADGRRMHPSESLIADILRFVHVGRSERTIRRYVCELRASGLANAVGRYVDLVPPMYAVAPPPVAGFVYAVEFSDGTVKIGRAAQAETRIDNHRATAASFGLHVKRATWCEVEHVIEAERLLIDALDEVAECRTGSEWFDGGYEVAARLFDEWSVVR